MAEPKAVKPILETTIVVPPISTPLVDAQGRMTQQWYEFYSQIARQLEAIRKRG